MANLRRTLPSDMRNEKTGRCADCGTPISRGAKRCRECARGETESDRQERRVQYGCTEACPGPRTRGLCIKHYHQFYKHGKGPDAPKRGVSTNRINFDYSTFSVVMVCRSCGWRALRLVGEDAEETAQIHILRKHGTMDYRLIENSLAVWFDNHPDAVE